MKDEERFSRLVAMVLSRFGSRGIPAQHVGAVLRAVVEAQAGDDGDRLELAFQAALDRITEART